MNKRRVLAVVALWFLCSVSVSAEVISPFSDKLQIQAFLEKLNNQGVIVSYDPSLKRDEITGQQSDLAFYLKGAISEWYYLYEADINNDGAAEYILCSAGGSGGFFDIVAIYKKKDSKWVNVFEEIKLSLRRLIREADKESYDLEEGWSLMGGSIAIERIDGLVYFTLEKVTRKYEGKGFEEDFNPPQRYKFLWKNLKLNLIEYYIGDKIYKQAMAKKSKGAAR